MQRPWERYDLRGGEAPAALPRPLASTDGFHDGSFLERGDLLGRHRSSVPPAETDRDSLFASKRPPPGFSSDRSVDDLRNDLIGNRITRSHSAAPSFDRAPSTLSEAMLGLSDSCETPLLSNTSSLQLGAAIDRAQFLRTPQRPSSTGVIGSSSASAVRPAAKTLMDLIQEDFPEQSQAPDDLYGPLPGSERFAERSYERSPPAYDRDPYRDRDPHRDRRDFDRREFNRREEIPMREIAYRREPAPLRPTPQMGRDMHHRLEDERLMRPTPQMGREVHRLDDGSERMRPTPQYVMVDREGSMVTPPRTEGVRYVLESNPPPREFRQPSMPPPGGHTVYVNSSGQPTYSYATVQYHHSSQYPPPPHIVHQPPMPPPQGGGYHPNEQHMVPPPREESPQYYAVNSYPPPWQQETAPQQQYPPEPAARNFDNNNPRGQKKNSGRSSQQPRQRDGRNRDNKGRGRGKGRRGGGGGGAETRRPTDGIGHILEDLKNPKAKNNMTIFDLKGNIVKLCEDQNGSRFIQQRLDAGSEQEKEIVSIEILSSVSHLRNDVFGNYVIQKLFDVGTDRMKSDLYKSLRGEVYQTSLQMYGCRVIQKALDSLSEYQLLELMEELHHHVLSCIHDQNGNHVIQKVIEVVFQRAKKASDDGDEAQAVKLHREVEFIIDDVLENMSSLSCHPYGCRVIQRILEHSSDSVRERTLNKINLCNRVLLDDQYGNYICQHVLRYGREKDRDLILDMIIQNGILSLSRQKFASNVVEKLLKFGSPDQRKKLVRSMLQVVDDQTGQISPIGSDNGTSIVLLLVRDAYANYVVQTTLDVLPECEEKQLLLAELSSHSTELKHYTFAKHIVNKIS